MFFLFKNVAKEIIAVLILTKEHIEKLILSHTQQQTYSFISYIEVPFNTSPIFQSCFFLGSMVTPLKIVLSDKLGDGRQAWQGRSYSHSFCLFFFYLRFSAYGKNEMSDIPRDGKAVASCSSVAQGGDTRKTVT